MNRVLATTTTAAAVLASMFVMTGTALAATPTAAPASIQASGHHGHDHWDDWDDDRDYDWDYDDHADAQEILERDGYLPIDPDHVSEYMSCPPPPPPSQKVWACKYVPVNGAD